MEKPKRKPGVKIIAAVVTHNRVELLSRCLDHLLLQSRKLDKIIVINNGSTDDTEEVLHERGIECITQGNLGSSGGWHKAISIALEEDFDAIWLMDDDGFPDSRALHFLESNMHDGVALASSIVLKEDSKDSFVFSMPKLNKLKMPVLFGMPRKYLSIKDLEPHAENGTYEFAQLFNGALISNDAIRKVGNINTDYFIYGDEVDYFYRIKQAGRVISVMNAKHFHPDVNNRPYNDIKIYYYLKNSLILYKKYFPYSALYQIGGIALILFRINKKNGFKKTFSLLMGKRISIFYTAIYRGLMGKIGKDYDF